MKVGIFFKKLQVTYSLSCIIGVGIYQFEVVTDFNY
jgi:hypothetical protein